MTPDQLTLQELTLKERVRRFNLGTPTAMHVGTHELVNDLWRELEKHTAVSDMLAALELGLHLVQVRWPMTGPESEPEKSTIEFINTAERAIAKATGA